MRERRTLGLAIAGAVALASPAFGTQGANKQPPLKLVADVRAAVSLEQPEAGYAHDTIVEPHIAVNPRDGKHLVAAYQMGRGNGAMDHGVAVSFDGGSTWATKSLDLSRARPDMTTRVTDPVVAFGTGRHVYVASINADSVTPFGHPVIQHSADGGRTFSAPRAVLPATGSDQLGGLGLQDKVWITADTGDGPGHRPGRIYATWLTYVVGVLAAFSDDHGVTWSPAAPVYSPGGGPIPLVLPGGDLGVVMNSGTFVSETSGEPVPTHAGNDTIFYMRARGAGTTPTGTALVFDPPVTITEPHGTNRGQRTSTFQGADVAHLPSMSMDGQGRLAIVFDDNRFRSEPDFDPFVPGSPVTDPVIVFSRDGGATWTEPQRVPGPDRPYLNRFLSTVAGLPGGGFAVSWRQRQEAEDMAQASDLQDTYVVTAHPVTPRSVAMHWSEAVRVNVPQTTVSAAPRTLDGELFLGDYQGTAASANSIFIARPEARFGPDKTSTSALYVAVVRY